MRFDSPPLMEDVPCQVCTGRDDEETILLCDLCNHGYHIDCLEPALARVPRGPWLCPLCDQIADAVPTRDIVDDEEVLDYLAADKRHRPGTSRKDAKRIARRAQNYYFAAEEFPIEWRTRNWPLVRKATRGFGPRTVPWYEDRLDIIKELHDDMGHYGINRTLHLIKERFYWTDMSLDVKNIHPALPWMSIQDHSAHQAGGADSRSRHGGLPYDWSGPDGTHGCALGARESVHCHRHRLPHQMGGGQDYPKQRGIDYRKIFQRRDSGTARLPPDCYYGQWPGMARRIPDINGPMLHRSKKDQPIPSTSQRPRREVSWHFEREARASRP
eukprot:jgi/Botrbrau1/33/Bobra.0022s0028.1